MKRNEAINFARSEASRLRERVLCGSVVTLLLAVAGTIFAQTAHFTGTQTAVGSGLSNPHGVTVDANGNVYIADTGNNRVLRVPANDPTCALGLCTNVGSGVNGGNGFYGPEGVTTDSSGDVYVTDTQNQQVVKLSITDLACAVLCKVVTSYSGGSYVAPIHLPTAIALDGAGNVYFAEDNPGSGVNNGVVTCDTYLASCEPLNFLGLYADYSTQGSHGLAFDASGNLYIGQPGRDDVFVIYASDPTCSGLTCKYVPVPFNNPSGLAIDTAGYLYVADTGNNRFLKVLLTDPACSTPGDCTSFNVGLNSPFGLALDAGGSLYVADSGNNRVLKFNAGGYADFGSIAVNQPSSNVRTVVFTFDSTGNLGSSPVSVLTNGAPNADFTDAGTGTCTTNGSSHIYAVGEVCTVDVMFKPTLPGVRYGAVVLSDSSGNVLATGDVQGTGVGPQINFLPGSMKTLLSGMTTPSGIAVDGQGNTYISSGKTVLEAPHTGPVRTIATLPYAATALALDTSGNLFAILPANFQIDEIEAVAGSIPNTPIIRQFNLTNVNDQISGGFAVDRSGNIFVAYTAGNSVIELVKNNGYAQTGISLGFSPAAIAVDQSGNIFVTDYFGDQLRELVAVNGQIPTSPTVKTLGGGFGAVTDLVVDGLGNLYVTDSDSNLVREIVAVNGMIADSPAVRTLGSFSSPVGVAVDGTGNIFIADAGNNTIKEIDLEDPPSFFFPTATYDGTTDTTDPPQSVQILNRGNAPLSLRYPGLTISRNFAQAAGSGTPADCTTLFSLVAGDQCNLSIQFTPTTGAGAVTGMVEMFDNTGNNNSAVQIIPLMGTAIPQPYIQTQPASQTIHAGQTATLTVTATSGYGLSYQWFRGVSPDTSNPVIGATSSSFATPALAATTNYWVVVFGGPYYTNSATAVITVAQSPAITLPPVNKTINSGQTATLGVVATGTAPLTYQWYQGTSQGIGAPVPGATAATFITPPLTMTTTYAVQVSNVAGTASSPAVVVTVNQPPTITSSPSSQTINAGRTATLTVAATGTAPLAYQWYQGTSQGIGTPVPGATAATFTTPALTATTTYSVQVSNVAGIASSPAVVVTVNQPPTITSSPSSQTINTGQTAMLNVIATGTTPLNYQWYQGTSPNPNSPIAGATAATFTSSTLAITTSYWVHVSNAAGTVNSATAIVTVNQPPSCTLTVAGTSTALAVIATSVCTDPQNLPLTETISWGDGTSSPATGTNQHAYAVSGSFTVVLSATDQAGLSVTAQVQITPSQLPVCTLGVVTGTASTYAVATSVSCSDPQSQMLTSYIDWGDGNVLPAVNNASNAHTYATSGMFNVTAMATDKSGLTGRSARQPVNVLPQTAIVSPGGSTPVTGTVPAQMTPATNTQVTFVCTSVSTVLNGQPTTNVLPSQYGITCTSPTVTLTASPTPVNVTIQTTTTTTVTSNTSTGGNTTAYGVLFPVSGLALFAIGNISRRRRWPRDSRSSRFPAIKLCALAVLCISVASCTQGFKPPPVIATPVGQYYVTLVETVVNPPAPTGFIQSSLIVPLPVSTGN